MRGCFRGRLGKEEARDEMPNLGKKMKDAVVFHVSIVFPLPKRQDTDFFQYRRLFSRTRTCAQLDETLYTANKYMLISLVGLSRPLMSRIERKYCSISTSYLVGLSDIFILLHISIDRIVCFGVFSPLRTLCDAYHKEFESH